jgi:hypothetical protein
MNAPKVTDLDYINFLVAAPRVVSCTEAARVQPDSSRRAAHDALTRLLQRLEPDTTPLWREAEQHVDRQTGLLIADDSTLDKPYAHKIELVHRHWSLKHHHFVSGINLLTLLWRALSISQNRQKGPNGLPLSCAAPIGCESGRADSCCQNWPDLARRVAASAPAACWAA